MVLFFLGSCSSGPPESKTSVQLDQLPPSGKLLIEILHDPAGGDACPTFQRGEVCRDLAHWVLKIQGEVYRDWDLARPGVEHEADAVRSRSSPQVSELKVGIKSGAQVPYPLPQRVLNLCAKVGIYRIEVAPSPR